MNISQLSIMSYQDFLAWGVQKKSLIDFCNNPENQSSENLLSIFKDIISLQEKKKDSDVVYVDSEIPILLNKAWGIINRV